MKLPWIFRNGSLSPNLHIDLHGLFGVTSVLCVALRASVQNMNDTRPEQTEGWDTGHTSLGVEREWGGYDSHEDG